MNVKKQINHWVNGAIDALDTAEILIEKRKILHGLFFCHLSILFENIMFQQIYIERCNIQCTKKNLYYLCVNTF